ncbi:MAG: hypothetical protein GY906_25335 [bacterium]|nr:hypothetical protein [bacterium]
MLATIVQQYTYLIWSLLLFGVFLLLFWVTPHKRQAMLVASLYSTPYAVASLMFVPEYWTPVRLGNLAIGVEDLVFSFANGGVVWWMASRSSEHQIHVEFKLRQSLWRYWKCSNIGIFVAGTLWVLGVRVMPAFWLSMALLFGFFLLKHPWYWRLSIAGALGFTGIYAALTSAVFHLNPGFALQWTAENLSGHALWDIPIEEFAWAFGYGAVFPMLVAYTLQAKLRKSQPTLVESPEVRPQ